MSKEKESEKIKLSFSIEEIDIFEGAFFESLEEMTEEAEYLGKGEVNFIYISASILNKLHEAKMRYLNE